MKNFNYLPFLCLIPIGLFSSCSPNPPVEETENEVLKLGIDQTIDLNDREELSFVWIETIGSWVCQTEITLGQLKSISSEVEGEAARYAARYVAREDDLDAYPAVNVSWRLAKDACEILNERFKSILPDGLIFRLPTEEEWEAFAKCGEDRLYPWGDAWPPSKMTDGVLPNLQGMEQIEIDATNAKPISQHHLIDDYYDGWPSVAPAYKSGINEWGLFGVGGNVSEWCEGWYEKEKKLRLLKGASAFTKLPNQCEISFNNAVMGQSPAAGLFFWGTVRNQGNMGTGFRVVVGPEIGD